MKQNSVSLVKITRPILSGVFPRERLFHLLDRGRDRSIIYISGPPGSGKTTLVGSYLDARKLHNLWYRIDESDADVASFFYYMGASHQKRLNHEKERNCLFLSQNILKIFLLLQEGISRIFTVRLKELHLLWFLITIIRFRLDQRFTR